MDLVAHTVSVPASITAHVKLCPIPAGPEGPACVLFFRQPENTRSYLEANQAGCIYFIGDIQSFFYLQITLPIKVYSLHIADSILTAGGEKEDICREKLVFLDSHNLSNLKQCILSERASRTTALLPLCHQSRPISHSCSLFASSRSLKFSNHTSWPALLLIPLDTFSGSMNQP